MSAQREVILRRFELDDLLPVADIERMVYGSGGYQLLAVRQLYDLFPSLVWVAADADGKVVGHAFGAVAQDADIGWILNFAVIAHYRRSGTGTRLLQTLIEQLAASGVRCIRTTAETHNADAVRLYAKLGFEQVGIGANYYGDGTDRLIFERAL